jgi:LPXTG-motif cell wall-anchored protein
MVRKLVVVASLAVGLTAAVAAPAGADQSCYTGCTPGLVPGSIPGSPPGSVPGLVPGEIPGSPPGSVPGAPTGVPGIGAVGSPVRVPLPRTAAPSSSGGLPLTGTDVAQSAGLAAALVVGGVVLVRRGRRRARATS